jgi:hypothetical protein
MRPEDIRKLYRQETAATEEEARQAQQEAKTDPEQARRLILTLYALAGEDATFHALHKLVLEAALMQLIVIRAADDDQFALQMAELIIEGMERLTPKRTPRGKMRTTRSA